MMLIPQPRKLSSKKGVFDLKAKGVCLCIVNDSDERIGLAAQRLQDDLTLLTGRNVPLVPASGMEKNSIRLNFIDAANGDESYRLAISKDAVLIEGHGPAGLFRGMQTFGQLLRTCGSRLPCIEIADAPDFAARGVYHDVTRGKVPTLDTLKALADRLAFYKINQLQLYVEHTFAFRNIPELWQGKDPLTADEIRELDSYCRERFIDLVPSIATFGHLYELLRLERFEHLNELDIRASRIPHNLWDRMAHYTIDVSQEESYSLVKSMIDEYVPLFSSRYCNICCDETFDLGEGKNRQRAAAVGKGRLYVDFVKKLMDAVRDHGKTPMLWGDMVLHYPECIRELPDDAVYLNWGYGADVTDEAAKFFASHGVTQYVCPGVQGWSRFANDIRTASANIRRMVRYGKRCGAVGVLNTDWGDCGHVNFLAGSLHGMALGAALSWNASSYRADAAFDAAISALEWGDRTGAGAKNLRELGSLCYYHFGNIYAWATGTDSLWLREQELVVNFSGALLARRHKRALRIISFFERFAASGNFKGDAQDLDEFKCSARLIAWTLALLAFKKRNEYGQKTCPAVYGSREQLLADGRNLVVEFVRLWRNRNKESELRNVTGTFEKLFEKIENQPE